jgi:hypothetical protein
LARTWPIISRSESMSDKPTYPKLPPQEVLPFPPTPSGSIALSSLHKSSEIFLPESLAAHIMALSKVPDLDIHQLAHSAIRKLRLGYFHAEMKK